MHNVWGFSAMTVLKGAACQEGMLVAIRNSALPKLVKGFHLQGYEVLAGEKKFEACQLKNKSKKCLLFFFFLIIYIESFLWTAIPLVFYLFFF